MLVVATDGELGQTRATLEPGTGLGPVRRAEMREAARLLGVHRLVQLGYGDSGADAEVPADPPGAVRFARVPIEDAAGRLAAVLIEERADVLVTEDEGGGYGHRDHRLAHRVAVEAARIARTPRILYATMPFAYSSPRSITHWLDVRPYVEAKRGVLRAHASQTSAFIGGDRTLVRCLRLPQSVWSLLFGREWYIGPGAPGRRRSQDLFGP